MTNNIDRLEENISFMKLAWKDGVWMYRLLGFSKVFKSCWNLWYLILFSPVHFGFMT